MNGIGTVAVHAGREDLAVRGVHVPPIDLSSTYPLANVEAGGDSYESLAAGGHPVAGEAVYSRLWNPTVARFEQALAMLEAAEQAVAFASGMAALTACLLASRAAGKKHVVAVRPVYGGTDHLLDSGLCGTEVSWATPPEITDMVRADTGLVLIETPANPTLELVDIAEVVRRAGNVPVLVDNTFATPILQNPIALGARLVLHSATKFLGGHGDVTAGVLASDEEWAARLRNVRATTGAILHPLAGYMLLRGLQSLPVRIRAQQATATELANALTSCASVRRVHYPGLAQCDPAMLVGRQMSGPGSVLSFEVVGGYKQAAQVAESCRVITHAVSLGGVDTLIEHPASLTHRLVVAEARPQPGLLRLSVGLEDAEDLIRDLFAAIDVSQRSTP